MSRQVVRERMRGFVSVAAHPEGCKRIVQRQIDLARRPEAQRSGGSMLALGASTGYGLASRIAGAFGHGMGSVGVFYERPPDERRTASAGWYNTAAFDAGAALEGLPSLNLNGDAFSAYMLERALDTVGATLGPLDVVVYSLAAPQRRDPLTGEVHKSVLKTVGDPHETVTVDLDTGRLRTVNIEAATQDEIDATVAVMGGADLVRWVGALLDTGLLARGARVMAYSYVGPEVTWPVYRDGTIGRAKADLEAACRALDERVASAVGGSCRVVLCKSIVTQASAAIPAVPLYMSILFRVMKDAGTHEGAIEQMIRLFDAEVGGGSAASVDGSNHVWHEESGGVRLDESGRVRLDELELHPDIQDEVARRWRSVTDANLEDLADFEGYRRDFRQLFGFDVPGVDYDAPVETRVPLDLVD